MLMWQRLLHEQRASGFRDVAGAAGELKLPVSDRLLTSLIVGQLPRGLPVQHVSLQAEGDDRFTVRIKLQKPAFLPPITIRCAVAAQPRFPEWPVLTIALRNQGLATVMGPLLQLFARLPPWARLDGDRLLLDIRALAEAQGVADLLALVTEVQVRTVPGSFVVSAKAAVNEQPTTS
jgi:hypothetical protein